jgi:two-component system, OmpR family, sensor histidine kinase VicK
LIEINSSSPHPPETTEVLYGNDNVQRRTLEVFSRVKETLDGCNESTEVAMNVKYEAIWNGFAQLKRKGVRLRAITEVTLDNITYVKKIMELFEMRHLKGLRSNFGIVDRKECLLHSISHEDQPLSHAIITNAKALVEAQQFLFETLWNQAVPAQEKILEIEEAMRPPFIETLRDPHEIQRLVFDLVNSAKQEILMLLFPDTITSNILQDNKEHTPKILQAFEVAMQKGINIRILTSEETLQRIGKLIARENGRNENDERELVGVRKQGKFEIHLFDTLQRKRLQTNISFLIVDSKVSLVEELNYNSSSDGELSLVTYSNSDSTVFTYVSIFETLWAQTE